MFNTIEELVDVERSNLPTEVVVEEGEETNLKLVLKKKNTVRLCSTEELCFKSEGIPLSLTDDSIAWK